MSIITADVVFMRPQIGISLSYVLRMFCTKCQVIHFSFVLTDSQSNTTSIRVASQYNSS